jgi:hypothetical protein
MTQSPATGPDETPADSGPPPEHGNRYDHRDDEQRAADVSEPTVDAPLLEGAAELRAEAQAALDDGTVRADPAVMDRPDDQTSR